MATVTTLLEPTSTKIQYVPNNDGYQDPVVFGCDDQQWEYLPESRVFDLSRGSQKTLTLSNEDVNTPYDGIKIDPSKTCLAIVDMQNYFINPKFCVHPPGITAIAPILQVIKRCRSEGIQVVWLNWVTDEVKMRNTPAAVLRCFNRARANEHGHGWGVNIGSPLPGSEERVLFEGTYNADLYAPLKAAATAEDVFCKKTRMSGMWSPDEDLHRYLATTGKKTVLFAGINTDQCVLSTITDAHSWGWDCILLKDCTGTLSGAAAQAVTEQNVGSCIGFVSDSKSLVDAKKAVIRKKSISFDTVPWTSSVEHFYQEIKHPLVTCTILEES